MSESHTRARKSSSSNAMERFVQFVKNRQETTCPVEDIEAFERDFWHATEHLSNALIAAYGETHPKRHSQYEKLKIVLKDDVGGVDRVIRALVHLRDKHPRRKNISSELGYFRRNRHRMIYTELKQKNLPIGTGVTEAACKTLSMRRYRCTLRWTPLSRPKLG